MSVYAGGKAGRREGGEAKGPRQPDQLALPTQHDPSHTEPSTPALLPASPPSRLGRLRRFAGWGMLALVLLVGLSGCGLGTDENPYTSIDPETGIADDIQGLYKTIFYMATVVFVLVQFLIVYTALRYRRKRRATTRPAQVHGNSRLEITWTIIPAVVLLIILIPTISILYSMDADAEDDDGAMIVEVFGKQWWWELHYPGMGPDETQPLVTANEVRLPVDQKVIFRMQSNNVIHSFWVPQLSGKMDVMPGYENKMTFTTPSEPGEYFGECAEFCGVAHAWMRFKVIVMPQEDFDAWVAAWNAPASYDANPETQGISEAPSSLGACLACHNVNNAVDNRGEPLALSPVGFDAAYTTGPNLTLFGCRESFAGGLMTTNEENLRAWLQNPDAVKEANLMGTVIKEGTLNDQQITELVAYLLALRMPDGSCPADLANTSASGADLVGPGGVPEGVATPAATPAPPATPEATPGATPAATPEGEAGATPEGEAGAPAQTVELSAPGIAWSTNEITIAQGGTIKLINDGSGGPHNFIIEGYNDDAPVDMPAPSEVDWTVPDDLAPGTYTFYCGIPGHRALMEGTITITAPDAAAAPPAEETPPAEGEAPPAADAGGGEVVELSAPGIAWSTNEITIARGGTIHLVNDGSGGPHNFIIEGYNDDAPVDMPAGSESDWVVPGDLAPGTYTFYCGVPGHRALMEGTITIT